MLADLVGDANPAGGLIAAAAREAERSGAATGAGGHGRPGPAGRYAGGVRVTGSRPAGLRAGSIWAAAAVLAAAAAAAVIGGYLGLGRGEPAGRLPAESRLAIPAAPAAGQRAAGAQAGPGAQAGAAGTRRGPGARAGAGARPGAPVAPAPAATVPAGMAGTWTGWVRQAYPVATFRVRLVLRAASGTVSYQGTGFACWGTVTVTGAGGHPLSLAQVIVHGRSDCADGQVRLWPGLQGAVQFSFRGQAGPPVRGTLARA